MKCPIDDTILTITERQGVEIDYCPTCRGVWLDRGELDKIIERADQFNTPPHAPRPVQDEHRNDDRRDHDYSRDERRHYDDSHHGGHDNHRKPHKKESFMSDLFDF